MWQLSQLHFWGWRFRGFCFSMFLMLIFSVYNHWFPVAGYASLSEGILEHLKYLFVPALSLGIVQAAYLTRMIRSSLLDVLHMKLYSYGTLKRS